MMCRLYTSYLPVSVFGGVDVVLKELGLDLKLQVPQQGIVSLLGEESRGEKDKWRGEENKRGKRKLKKRRRWEQKRRERERQVDR